MKKLKIIILVILAVALGGFAYLAIPRLIPPNIPNTAEAKQYTSWTTDGLGKYIPSPFSVIPTATIGKNALKNNSDKGFRDGASNVTAEGYQKYVEALKSWGYTKEMETRRGSYIARNNKVKVWVDYDALLTQLTVTLRL